MLAASVPANDPIRVEALRRLDLLDTEAERRFDGLVELAANLLGVPVALLSLVDEKRQWFKSRVGLDAVETPRDISFCGHAVDADDARPFVVEDALADERFADNPLVTGDLGVRFYAGQVVHDAGGFAVGTLCVLDRQPRHLEPEQLDVLVRLGALIEDEFTRTGERRAALELEATSRSHRLILDTLNEGLVLLDANGRIVEWNPAAERVLGLTGDQLVGRTATDERWAAVLSDGSPLTGDDHPAAVTLRTGRPSVNEVIGVHQGDGSMVWLRVNSQPVFNDAGAVDGAVVAFMDVTAETESARHSAHLEAELRRSEEAARVSLDALEQGVILAHSDGTIRRLNPAAEAILGYNADELSALWRSPDWVTYDEDGSVLPPERRPLVMAILTGRPVTDRIVGWRCRDGERILIRLSVIPTADALVIGFTDVTTERLAHRLLDTTLDTAPVGLAILDQSGQITRCNSEFARQAGRSDQELIGVDIVSLLTPDQQPAAIAAAAEMRVLGSTAPLEQRIVRPDGTEVWVKTHLAAVAGAQRPFAIAATYDVTDQLAMIHELTRFGHLVENANDIVVIIDASGDVIYASPSTERILGYPDGHRYVGGLLSIVHPSDRAQVADAFKRLISRTDASTLIVARVVDVRGQWRHLECVGVNMLDQPSVAGLVITARDATDRVQLAEQLAHRATHDVLTGLPNRQLLHDVLHTSLKNVAQVAQRVAVCFIDVDGFKSVNDTKGHAYGDSLLIAIADRLEQSIRNRDTAARVGGDEFVVLLDGVSGPAEALVAAERIRDSIVRLRATHDVGKDFGASLGVALSKPNDSPSSLLQRADAAMYRAKAQRCSAIEISLDDTFVTATWHESTTALGT